MKHVFKELDHEMKLFAIIYFLFGLVLCFFNKNILIVTTRIVGIVFVVFGLFQLYLYFFYRRSASTTPLFLGIPATFIGCMMLFSPESFVAILPVLGGVILSINSIIQMQKSFLLKDYGYDNWIYNFAISVILLGVGIILLLKPIQSLKFILQLVGICLIIESICILFNQHEIKKYIE